MSFCISEPCTSGLQNQFDSIDLSDNNVIILEGFPKLPRLKTLLLNNNRITRIGRHLEGVQNTHGGCVQSWYHDGAMGLIKCAAAESIPNLTHLILTNNRLKHLAVSPESLSDSYVTCFLTYARYDVEKPGCLQDLEPLSTLPRLQHLSLLDNDVTKVKHYR